MVRVCCFVRTYYKCFLYGYLLPSSSLQKCLIPEEAGFLIQVNLFKIASRLIFSSRVSISMCVDQQIANDFHLWFNRGRKGMYL